MSQGLIPASFAKTALAFPEKVRAMAIETPKDGAKAIAQADVLKNYAKRIGSDLAIQNAIAEGRLILVRRTGEMLLKMPRGKAGRKKDLNSLSGLKNFSDLLKELPVSAVAAATWQKTARRSTNSQ